MFMSPMVLSFLSRILCFSLAVYVTARIMPGIQVRGMWSAIWVAITYAFLNFVAYEVLGIFSFSFGILTLGFGFWIINAALLLITDRIVEGFKVNGFFAAAFGSLMIAILNSLIVRFIGLLDGKAAHFVVPSIQT